MQHLRDMLPPPLPPMLMGLQIRLRPCRRQITGTEHLLMVGGEGS